MLYSKEEMLRICKKYGIETIKKEGTPLYLGKEMTDDFSFEQMMREPCLFEEEKVIISSEKVSFTVPVYSYNNKKYNDYHTKGTQKIDYKNERNDNNIESHIKCSNVNIFAA